MTRRSVYTFGVLTLLVLALHSIRAYSCDLQFAVNAGQEYPVTDFRRFIETEVRPKLSSVEGTFVVSVYRKCGSNPGEKLNLTFDQRNFYIIHVQNHALSGAEARYQTSPLTINRTLLESEIAAAESIDSQTVQSVHDLVKTLAFFFAESARFSSVEDISWSLVSANCSAHWLDYATLLRRWSVLSRFALHTGGGDWTAQGGSSGRLIAPISSAEINKYDAAIAAGKDGPDAAYVDDRDWNSPINVPPAACTQ